MQIDPLVADMPRRMTLRATGRLHRRRERAAGAEDRIAGGVLGFAKALGEFGATITFVSNIPGETQTLALAIYSFLQSPSGDEAAITLVIIGIAISFLAILASEVLASRMTREKTIAR